MPSTTSSCVSSVFDSSTVMTPSLPTFFMASAMILPMVSSLLAEMVPTWLIMLSLLTGFENLSSSPLTRLPSLSILPQMVVTAFSMPRLRAIGLAPAATVLTPSRKIAWARTVAVVVPSPATSEVFEATSRTICAPMFSSAFDSSISLATVTPSLVIVGEPNFFSITTLRPFGPSVTFTASARMLTPRRIACRESSPCRICFAIVLLLFLGLSTDQICLNKAPEAPVIWYTARSAYFLRMPRTSSSRMIRYSSPSSLISVPEYLPNRMVSPDFTSRGNTLPSSFDLPLPTEITSPCCGFSFAESGMMIPPTLLSPSSMRRTRMRSCSGVNDVFAIALHLLVSNYCYDFGERNTVRVVLRSRPQPFRRDQPQNQLELLNFAADGSPNL